MAYTNKKISQNHAFSYLAQENTIPYSTEGKQVLLEVVPKAVRKILNLGTLEGSLLSLLKIDGVEVESVAVDFSTTMLEVIIADKLLLH